MFIHFPMHIPKLRINPFSQCSQQCGLQSYHSNDELTFELNRIPRTHTEVFTNTSTLVHPTIITYIDDGTLENLTIYIFNPHFINNEASTVTLELPPALIAWRISPTFHTGPVWKFVANNNKLFPKRDTKSFYDFCQDDKQEWLIEEITSHHWSNLKELELEVMYGKPSLVVETKCSHTGRGEIRSL